MKGSEWLDEDGKKHFRPEHEMKRCFRCGRRHPACAVKACPKSGNDMCVNCCARCRFSTKTRYTSALGCSFSKESA